jgi:hypothetical protein
MKVPHQPQPLPLSAAAAAAADGALQHQMAFSQKRCLAQFCRNGRNSSCNLSFTTNSFVCLISCLPMLFHIFRRSMLFLLPETESRDSNSGQHTLKRLMFQSSTINTFSKGLGPTTSTTGSAATTGLQPRRITFPAGVQLLFDALYLFFLNYCNSSIRAYNPLAGSANPYATGYEGF